MTSSDSALWADYTAAHPEFSDRPTPPVDLFGYSPDVCDSRLELVLTGEKRVTADFLADYAESVRGMPAPGDFWLAADSQGVPRVVLRTVVTRADTLKTVDDEFARDYAEGGRTAASWFAEQLPTYLSNLPEETEGIEHETVVFERFAVVWPEDRVTDADREWVAEVDRFY